MAFVEEGGYSSAVWAVVGQTLWWKSANKQGRWCNNAALRDVSVMIWQLNGALPVEKDLHAPYLSSRLCYSACNCAVIT